MFGGRRGKGWVIATVAVVALVDTREVEVELDGNPTELLECGRLQRC